MIKVRFAPSPTGYLHIGGARTALFNWMYARSQNGIFVLRIEDTDLERSKPEFSDEILRGMEWLGLKWDEFYRQSDRFELYRQHAQKLLETGKAYRDGEAVILKMPQQEIRIDDLIRGEIKFDTSLLKDEVLMKSDGSPTYSFACVVDDALMEISHVIRGEDHISNTPKQIAIYQALGLKAPKFAHLPLIMGSDGARLSKRTGAVAVSDYQKEGYLPEAIVNYLMLLGWSPGNNQEKVNIDSAVKKFSIKKVNKTAAMFNIEKLKWLNAQYIKEKDTDELAELALPFFKEKGYLPENYDRQYFKNIVQLYKIRTATVVDFLDWTGYLFTEHLLVDPELKAKHLLPEHAQAFRLLAGRLAQLEDYQPAAVENVFRQLVEELGLKAADLVHPVRVALTGHTVGPGLFETMAVLGKEKTIRRLEETFR